MNKILGLLVISAVSTMVGCSTPSDVTPSASPTPSATESAAADGTVVSESPETPPSEEPDVSPLGLSRFEAVDQTLSADGNFTITNANLEKNGFIVVMSDSEGKAGEIIGMSSLLEAGKDYQTLDIKLDPAKAGSAVHVGVAYDNGDNTFASESDSVIKDSDNVVAGMMVNITKAE